MAGPISEEKIQAIFAKEPISGVQEARIHHVAYRVKDPEVSLEFYRKLFGMRLQRRNDIHAYKTTVYHIGYGTPETNPPKDIIKWKQVTIEFFHIWGSENEENLRFSNGNECPKGFCHVALQVPDVFSFAKQAETLGVKFIKKPDEGTPRGQAFLLDPDGYYIEVISESVPDPGKENPQLYNDMFKL